MTAQHVPAPTPHGFADHLPRRVLVAGYYGAGNLGDEAVLEALIRELGAAAQGVVFSAVSANVADTRSRHGIDAVDHRDVPAIIAAARASDLVVLGGGGLLHDYHGVDPATVLCGSHWGLSFCASLAAVAWLAHKPFVLWGIGAGPLTTDEGRRLTGLLVNRANLVNCRDDASAALLAEVTGRPRPSLVVAAEPACLLGPESPEAGATVLAASGVPLDGRPLVAVALRPWSSGASEDEWQRVVAESLDGVLESSDARLVTVPFQESGATGEASDTDAADAVVARMRNRGCVHAVPAGLSRAQVQSVFAHCQVVVGMRLHALVLASAQGVPAVGLEYDPKVRLFMSQLGVESRVHPLASCDARTLSAQILDALGSPASDSSGPWTRSLETLRGRAREGVASLADVLRENPEPVPSSDGWSSWMRAAQCEALRREFVKDQLYIARERDVEATVRQLNVDMAERDGRLDVLESRLVATAHGIESFAVLERRVEALEQRLVALEMILVWFARVRRAPGHIARTVAGWVGALARYAVQFARKVWAYLPPGLRSLLRPLLPATPPSPAGVAFDSYRQRRAAVFGASLAALRTPAEPGLVSVVLPAHNGALLMGESIESVLNQTWTHLELVIVDDGSSDDTLEVARSYALRDGRVRVVQQDHRRLPATLSHGFRLAGGEFLTWTSCDNRMKPDCLERMVAALREHPSWDMVYANLDMIGEDGAPLRGSGYYEGYQCPHGSEHVHLPRSVSELNVVANNYVGAAFMYRSRVAWLLGDYSGYRFVMEDYDYFMRVNNVLTLRHVGFSTPLYEYRFHSSSLTSRWEQFDMLKKRERMMVFDDFRRDFCLAPMVWIITGDDRALVSRITEWVCATGQVATDGSAWSLADVPPFGVPVLHVHAATRVESATRAPLPIPPCGLRALVTSRTGAQPGVAPEWDLCAIVDGGDGPDALPGDYRGWATGPLHAVCHAIDIRAREAYCRVAEQWSESPEPPSLAVSVVICSRRPAASFQRMLEALARECAGDDDVEVVVVDNEPDQPHVRAVLSATGLRVQLADRLRYVACPIPGLSAARNAGVGVARGSVMCYLDDDAVVTPGWLTAMRAAFDGDETLGVVGGHIRLCVPEPRPSAVPSGWEPYWSEFLTGHTEVTLVMDWSCFPYGANWAARRTALLEMGGFRTRYGRVGGNFWGGEELVAAALAQRLGYGVAVQPAAEVVHEVDQSRFTFDHVRRTIEAGQQVYRLACRDRYVPHTTRLLTVVRSLVGGPRGLRSQAGTLGRREAWYRFRARLRVAAAAAREAAGRRYPGAFGRL